MALVCIGTQVLVMAHALDGKPPWPGKWRRTGENNAGVAALNAENTCTYAAVIVCRSLRAPGGGGFQRFERVLTDSGIMKST
jgi:hypothetical protein